MIELANKIKELREEKDISLEKLAKILEVSNVAIYNWENNINEPKAKYLKKLAIYFNVSSDYLLGIDTKSNKELYTEEFKYTDETHTITYKKRR